MANLICNIRTRKIYGYLSQIIIGPYKDNNKWTIICDIIWDKNGIPIRESGVMLEFKTKAEAEAIKIGDCVREETELYLDN